MVTQQKRTFAKYTKEHEQKIVHKMKELWEKGIKSHNMAGELNKAGLRTASGGLWTNGNCSNFFSNRRRQFLKLGLELRKRRTKRTRARTRQKPAVIARPAKFETGSVSKTVIMSIITDPNLNATQALKMVGAYLEA